LERENGESMLKTDIQLLKASTFVSGLGSAISILAIPWVIYEYQDSVLLVSYYFLISQILSIFLLPWFGALVDTHERVAIARNVQLTGCAFQIVTILAWIKFESPEILAITAALSLTTRSLDQVVRSSLIHAYTENRDYLKVNRVFELIRQSVTFAGALLAIVIFGAGGILLVLVIDCATFVTAAVLMNMLSKVKVMQGSSGIKSLLSRQRESRQILKKHKILAIVVAASAVPTSGVIAMSTIYPKHFADFLHTGPASYYLFDAVYAAGAICMAAIMRRNIASAAAPLTVAVTLAIAACFVIVISSIPSLWVTYAMIAGFASITAFIRILRTNLIMANLEPNEQGRAHGLVELVSTFLLSGLILASGLAADWVNLKTAWYVFFAANLLAAGLIVWTVLLPRQRIDEYPVGGIASDSGVGNKKSSLEPTGPE